MKPFALALLFLTTSSQAAAPDVYLAGVRQRLAELPAERPLGCSEADCAAVHMWREACHDGEDAQTACVLVGYALTSVLDEDGSSSDAPDDDTTAVRYFLLGCLEGNGASCYAAGTSYDRGLGVSASRGAALSLMETACDLGDRGACYQACTWGDVSRCPQTSPRIRAIEDRKAALRARRDAAD